MIVYIPNLLRALLEVDATDEYVLFTSRDLVEFFPFESDRLTKIVCPAVPASRLQRVLYEQAVYPALIRRYDIDIFLGTCNVLPLFKPCPSVVVLQSLQYFLFPNGFSWMRRKYLSSLVPLSLRRADAVIAVSESAKRDAIQLTGIPPEKIWVVYHGVSHAVQQAVTSDDEKVRCGARQRYSDGRPYILAISTLYHFKNYERLVKAFCLLKEQYALPHRLVIAGQDADLTLDHLLSIAERHGRREDLVCLGGVPHDQVATLYKGADLLAYVSLYETFGHPVIEAMMSGCPVVTSNTSSLPEVAGDAAYLVDPYSIEEVVDGIYRVLTDSSLRSQLTERGFRRSSEFTWYKTARETLKVLESVA